MHSAGSSTGDSSQHDVLPVQMQAGVHVFTSHFERMANRCRQQVCLSAHDLVVFIDAAGLCNAPVSK